VFLLYAVNTLGLDAGRIGIVMSMAGVGFCAASVVVTRLQQRIGLGPAMLAGLLLTTLAWAAAAGAGGHTATAQLALAMAGEGFGAGVFFLGLVSLRQARAPAGAVARVVTSMRFLTIGATPLGALLGGWAAEQIGLGTTIALAAAAGTAAVLAAALASPLRRLRQAG
jgi:predicted MFS family arabinose efflux permease